MSRLTHPFRHSILCGALVLLSLSCGGQRGADDLQLRREGLLTGLSRADVLGFEVQGTWTASTTTLRLSATHTEGKSSLEVTPKGWLEVFSAQLGSLGVGPVHSISYDLRTPLQPTNPSWFGETQLYVNLPSQGIWHQYVGRFDLLAATPGQFTTVTYALPDTVAQKLAANYSDLGFSIVLNTPAGTASYLLDNLRFNNGKVAGGSALPDCPRFLRVLSNGDVVAELTTAARQSLVELAVRRNGADTTSVITASEVHLQNGAYAYSAALPRSSNQVGDSLSARFRTRALGSTVDQFTPGPDAAKFGDMFSYDPTYACIPVSDLDGDGVKDSIDACPADGAKSQPGLCGCGQSETDTDHDGTPDCLDECAKDPNKSVQGDCGCAGAYAPAGTACTDGPCPGKNSCDGNGKCGGPLACLIPGTVGLPRDFRFGDDIFYLQPNDLVTWPRSGNLAPAGYARITIDDPQKVTVLASQIKKYYGPSACVWTTGTVTAPGVISSVPRNGATPRAIWNRSAQPPNIDNGYLPFAPGQPPAGVSSGCVSLSADGLLRVENCEKSCAIVYERSALTLIAKANPADFRVGCQDLPGVVCKPLDGYDMAAESDCTPASALPEPGSPEAAAEAKRIDDCSACQQHADPNDPNACSSLCTGMAAPPAAGDCRADPGPQFCRVQPEGVPRTTPDPSLKTCIPDTTVCPAKQVCGVYAYVAAADPTQESADYWQTAAPCTQAELADPSKRSNCRTVRVCGAPDSNCELKDPADVPQQNCRRSKICVVDNPIGNPDPLQQAQSKLSSDQFDPTSVFTTIPEPPPSPIGEEPPFTNPTPDTHPWCKFAPSVPAEQKAPSGKHGEAGNGSFVQLAFDPNIDLNYNVTPLAQGDMDFNLRAAATFKASTTFNLKGKTASFDIVDAQIVAAGDRCGLTTDGRLDIFGVDFVPLIPALRQLHQKIPADRGACEAGIAAFQEVASRAKKAMRDAQELITQYHDALAKGFCFDPTGLCTTLMAKAPPGFPKVDCSIPGFTVEDIVNTFIWYYERQVDATLPVPDWLRSPNLHFNFKNPLTSDSRLPNLRLPKDLPSFPSLPDYSFSALPDLEGAQQSLAEIAPGQNQQFGDAGCSGDKVKTERQTLATVAFALGPIPMLLEVEGVLKYGVDYGVGFAFNPKNLITTSSARAPVASVVASAEPCASAGVALFVGAGFSMGGFKAAAGVEGMVNLVTLSMPAHASASVQAAREQVSVLDPLSQLPDDGAGGRIRYVSKELRKYWDGTTFPVYRQKVYLGYDYGARVEATEILKGKLSATVAVKFFFIRKKWRATLVNFGDDSHEFKRTLIHGDGEFDVASGPFPWTTLDMPDAFVKFRPLSFVPPDFLGSRFADLQQFLRSSVGPNFTWPNITLPQLDRLDLDLPNLTSVRVPEASLPDISARLGLTLADLRLRFQNAGIALANLTFADFAKIGFKLIDFRGLPVTDDQLLALNPDLSGMMRLGFDLSMLTLPKVNVASQARLCTAGLDLSRVGDFFFDNYCPHAPPAGTVINQLVAFGPEGKSVCSGGGASCVTYENDLVAHFPGNIRPDSLHVLVEAGDFDDRAEAIGPATSIAVSSVSACNGTVGQANGADVASLSKVSFDAKLNQTTVTFHLRATDKCGTHVGWSNVNIRYQGAVR